MSYMRVITIALGASKSGLTLRAQLIDSSGTNVGDEITTGFVDLGTGNYLLTLAAIPDDLFGGVKIYPTGGAFSESVSINPPGDISQAVVAANAAATAAEAAHAAADAVNEKLPSNTSALLAHLDADVSSLRGAAITYSSPTASSGSFVVVAGDDYLSTDGRALAATVTGYSGPSLTGASAVFRAVSADEYSGDCLAAIDTAAVITQTGTTVAISVSLTAAQTELLQPDEPYEQRNCNYQIIATTAGGSLVTLAAGKMTVKKAIKPAA